MKQIAFGVVAGIVLILFVCVIVAINGRTLRQNEVEQSLETAMEHVMKQLEREEGAYDNQEDFLLEFLEALLIQIDSTSDIEVRVLGADEKKGLISVEVIETYQHPNGRRGTVSVRRTMIWDRRKT